MFNLVWLNYFLLCVHIRVLKAECTHTHTGVLGAQKELWDIKQLSGKWTLCYSDIFMLVSPPSVSVSRTMSEKH